MNQFKTSKQQRDTLLSIAKVEGASGQVHSSRPMVLVTGPSGAKKKKSKLPLDFWKGMEFYLQLVISTPFMYFFGILSQIKC